MLLNLKNVDIGDVLFSSTFIEIAFNSVLVTSVASLISVVLALVSAWLVSRSNIRDKKIYIILFTLPMLIPSISHGTGLIVLLGNNGVLTNIFHLNIDLYGFWGIVIGSLFYSFPVAFLMLYDNLQYEDGTVYLSANILGIPKYSQIINITLPYLKKTLISTFFATFTLIFTDYGIPLMVGGKFMTLPLFMYNEVIGLLDFGKGALIGCVLIIPAFIAFILDVINADTPSNSYNFTPYIPCTNKKRDYFAYIWCSLLTFGLVLPIVTFIFLMFVTKYPINISFSFEHIVRAFNLGMSKYLINSLIISFLTAIVGTFISFLTAYYTARSDGKFSRILHLIAMISLAIPGIVLGLSYVMFFKSSFIYGTIAMLVLVNSIHFFASPYLMCYNAMGKLNQNYESVASTLGIPKYKLIMDVIFPQTFTTVLEQFSYFFVNSMVTISAVSFLSTSSIQPLSLMIPNLESMMLIESISFVSITILAVNLILKMIIYFIKKIISFN